MSPTSFAEQTVWLLKCVYMNKIFNNFYTHRDMCIGVLSLYFYLFLIGGGGGDMWFRTVRLKTTFLQKWENKISAIEINFTSY